MVKVKCTYDTRKPRHDFLYDGNSNIWHICHNLQDIHNQNCKNLTLTFRMGQGQNVNMLFESSDMTYYLMTIVIFAHHLRDICRSNKMQTILLWKWNSMSSGRKMRLAPFGWKYSNLYILDSTQRYIVFWFTYLHRGCWLHPTSYISMGQGNSHQVTCLICTFYYHFALSRL